MLVARILSAKSDSIITIGPDATIPELAEILSVQHVGAVLVTDAAGDMVGIISERDVARGVHGHGQALFSASVADLMTREVITCGPENSVSDIVRLMNDHGIRHLPVMQDERPIGIVSMRDVVNNRLHELEIENETIRAQLTGL